MERKSRHVLAVLAILAGLGYAESATAQDCGCGGPKSYYAKKYGTVKPPQFNILLGTQTPAAPGTAAPAAPAGTATTTPVNPPATGSGG